MFPRILPHSALALLLCALPAAAAAQCDATALREATEAFERAYASGGLRAARTELVRRLEGGADACASAAERFAARRALAEVALDGGDPEAGAPWFEAAREVALAAAGRLRELELAGLQARLRAARGDLAGALADRDALAVELAARSDSTRLALENRIYRAGLLSNLGRADALAACEEALAEAARTLGEGDRLTLVARENLARALAPAGRHEEAFALATGSFARVRDAHGERGLLAADQLGLVAVVPLFAGDPAAARPAAERAVVITAAELGDDAPATLRALELANFVVARLGRIDEAIATQRRIVAALAARHGATHPQVLVARANLAAWLLAEGRAEEALPVLQNTVATWDAAGAQGRASFDIALDLSQALLDTGRTQEGCARAAALVERAAEPSWRVQAERTLARCLVAQRRWTEARELLRQAVRGAGNAPTHADAAALDALASLAHVELELGDEAGALATLERVRRLAEAERRREAPAPGSGRTLYARRVAGRAEAAGLRDLAWLLARRGNGGEAIAVAEEARARALADALALRSVLGDALMPSGERLRLRLAEVRLREGEAELALSAAGSVERARLSLARDALAAERDRLAHDAAIVARAALDVAAVASRLADDEAVIGLQWARGRAWSYVLRRGRAPAVHILSDPARVQRDFDALRQAAAHSDDRVALWRLPDGTHVIGMLPPRRGAVRVSLASVGRAAHAALLAPHAGVLAGTRHWTVVAEGPFAAFPLEVLHDGRGLVDVDITYAPSLAAHAHARLLPAGERAAALALVAFGPPDYAVLGAAGPGPHEGRRFASLPAAAEEIRRVAATVPRERGLVLDGPQASAARWAALAADGTLARTRWLHVAAHAVVVPDAPQWSALVLGGDARGPGYVTAAAIAATVIRAELVTLSACETALGREVAGEGTFGLPYALAVAGARGTVLTLWPVADRPTAEFMARLYAELARGVRPATALARTKRAFQRHPQWRAPAFWAPFVLVGAG